MEMGKKSLFEGIREVKRHLGPEGAKFQRAGNLWCETGICQLKLNKKKRKSTAWVLSVDAAIS